MHLNQTFLGGAFVIKAHHFELLTAENAAFGVKRFDGELELFQAMLSNGRLQTRQGVHVSNLDLGLHAECSGYHRRADSDAAYELFHSCLQC